MPRPGLAFLVVALAGYLPGLVTFHMLAPRPVAPGGAAFRMAAVQAVALLAWAPALGRPDRAFDPRAWVRLAVLVGAGAVALGVVEIPRGRAPVAEVVILAGFAAVLLGMRDLLRGLGLGERAARLAPLALGALSVTTLSFSGPLIEAGPDAAGGVDLALRVNPLAAIAGGVHGIDWARLRPITYDAFVGQYYPFSYPGALAAALGWAVAGAVLGATGAGIARRRARHLLQCSGPSDTGR